MASQRADYAWLTWCPSMTVTELADKGKTTDVIYFDLYKHLDRCLYNKKIEGVKNDNVNNE